MTAPPPTPPGRRRHGRVGDLLIGSSAAAAIVGVLIGVPWLLISVIGMPIAELVADLSDQLSSDNARASAALRLGLSVLVGLAWLQVAGALVVELLAAGLGRSARRSPLLVPAVQRSARNLVAAAMMLVTTFTAPASAATLAALQSPTAPAADIALPPSPGPGIDIGTEHDVVADVADRVGAGESRARSGPGVIDGGGPGARPGTGRPGWALPGSSPAGAAAGEDSGDAGTGRSAAGGPARSTAPYTVQTGDTLWSIAESTTGDGFAWRRIRQHNLGRLMSDGSPITANTETVAPGTVLLVPGLPEPPPDPAPPVAGTVEVERGDHFWVLAEEILAEGWGRAPTDAEITPYWVQMVDANRIRLAPPGDPDLIHPGQRFTIPPLPADPLASESPAPAVDPPSTAPTGTPDPPLRSPSDVVEPPSGPAVGSSGRAADPVVPDVEAVDDGAVGDPPVAGDAGREASGTIPFGVVAVTGLGLLTAAIARIVRRRQSQEMGRRSTGRGPRFDPPAMAEHLMATTADEAGLGDLDAALRQLGTAIERSGGAMPELVGAMVGASAIRLLLGSRHGDAPEPFRSERDGMMWTVPRPLESSDPSRGQGPFPAMVTVGHTDDTQFLIDLEYVGVMNLSGGLADVIDTMGTMAFELATSPLADTLEVVCVGFGEELGELERVSVVPTLDAVVERVEGHARDTAELVRASALNGPRGRAASVGDWTPQIVFDPLSGMSSATERLLAAVGGTSAGGVSAVVTTAGPDSLTCRLTDNHLCIPAYDVRLSRRVLNRAQRAALASAIADAAAPEDSERSDLASTVLAGTGTDHGASTATPPPPAGRSKVLVRVLGPLRVETAGGEPVAFDRSATPEFLAYLCHHRDGVGVEDAMNTLWPATTARRSWIVNVHADARRALGPLAGDGAVPRAGVDDRFRLSPLVAGDLELLRRGVESAVDLPVERAVELLIEALELVDGVPFTNVTNRWPIVEGHWQEATMLVDEAARCVATLALDQMDDPRLAAWAAAKGLLASPHSVALHRLRLQAAMAHDGDDLGPDAVFQHYQATVMADEHRPEGGARLDPGIVELYESYRRSSLGPAMERADRS